MWVRAYIAQLSAARAKPHRNRVCGPGHYGNSRAPGKRQVLSTLGKVAVTRGRGALQKAPEVPTRCGTVSLCGQPHAAAGLPLVTSIQGFNLLCQGSINPTSRLQPGFINETLTAFYCLVWHHSKEHQSEFLSTRWPRIISHARRVDLLDKTMRTRCCCATRRSVQSQPQSRGCWQSAASASPLAKLPLPLSCMSVSVSAITALGGLTKQGEAQAEF